MKQIFTFLLFSLLALAPCMAGDGGEAGDDGDDNNEVPMSQSTTGNGHNRGLTPEVYYSQTTGVMTVTFFASGSYHLTVTDASGMPAYTATLNTSGIPTAYVMNLADPGTYIVTISSAYETFTGPLVLD